MEGSLEVKKSLKENDKEYFVVSSIYKNKDKYYFIVNRDTKQIFINSGEWIVKSNNEDKYQIINDFKLSTKLYKETFLHQVIYVSRANPNFVKVAKSINRNKKLTNFFKTIINISKNTEINHNVMNKYDFSNYAFRLVCLSTANSKIVNNLDNKKLISQKEQPS